MRHRLLSFAKPWERIHERAKSEKTFSENHGNQWGAVGYWRSVVPVAIAGDLPCGLPVRPKRRSTAARNRATSASARRNTARAVIGESGSAHQTGFELSGIAGGFVVGRGP